MDFEKLEEYDRNKTKVLKYVIYKKRSENEIRRKFQNNIDLNMLEDIIEELKDNNYISDEQYIKRAVNEYMALKNLSLKQIKYKLQSKGINNNLIEDYFSTNREELNEYEIKSARNIINKKYDEPAEEIIQNLLKKGFEYDNVKEALERREL
ncbi:MAG: RecX family transcriptional regulator [Clostridia bacterium]|nr:RecX family transcriptional regulator [Clostridia bacterium]